MDLLDLLKLLVSALLGGGLVNVLTARNAVKRTEFDILRETLNEIQEENGQLRDRLTKCHDEFKEDLRLLREDNENLYRGIRRLIVQMERAGIKPVWMPPGMESPPDPPERITTRSIL